jgi:hypothetical protein
MHKRMRWCVAVYKSLWLVVCGMATSEGGFREIHWIAYNDEIEQLRDRHQQDPTLIFLPSKSGNNTLHVAAAAGSPRVLSFLISLNDKSLTDAPNNWGETPLHVATAAGNQEVVRQLLQSGANYSLKDCWGRNPKTVRLHSLFTTYLMFIHRWRSNTTTLLVWKSCAHLISHQSKRKYLLTETKVKEME